MGIAELPKLYKAQGLAYKRSLTDEEWGIVHQRISMLVERLERLQARLGSLGLSLPEHMSSSIKRLSEAVERGSLSEAIEYYERLIEDTRRVGAAVEVYAIQAGVLRLAASIAVILASGIIFFSPETSLDPFNIAALSLAAGLAVAALFLHRYYEALYPLLGASAIMAIYVFGNMGSLPIDVTATALFAIAVSVFSTAHSLYTKTLVKGVFEGGHRRPSG